MVASDEENPLMAESKKKVKDYFSNSITNPIIIDRSKKSSCIEVAEACQAEMKRERLSQDKFGEKYGITRQRVSQILRVLKLPEEIIEMARKNPKITERQLRMHPVTEK